MNVLRAAIGILGLALLGLVIWAAFALQELHGSFLHQFSVVATLPWGIATVAAMIVAYLLLVGVVFLTERSWIVAALWCAPAIIATTLFAIATAMVDPSRLPDVLVWVTPGCMIGIVSAAAWLLLRLPHLANHLAKPE